MDSLTDLTKGLTVEALLLLLVIRESFSMIRLLVQARSESKADATLQLVSQMVAELHKWHNVKDSDGVPIWYVRRDLTNGIGELAALLKEVFTEVRDSQRDMIHEMKRTQSDISRLDGEVRDLTSTIRQGASRIR